MAALIEALVNAYGEGDFGQLREVGDATTLSMLRQLTCILGS
jgi:predicted lipid-binding transport protein (Tim44 family)